MFRPGFKAPREWESCGTPREMLLHMTQLTVGNMAFRGKASNMAESGGIDSRRFDEGILQEVRRKARPSTWYMAKVHLEPTNIAMPAF